MKERVGILDQTRGNVLLYRLQDVQRMGQLLTGTAVKNLYLEKEKLFKVLCTPVMLYSFCLEEMSIDCFPVV